LPEELDAGESWTLSGSVIGYIEPLDKMTPTYRLFFTARGSEQIPATLRGGFRDTLLATRTVGLEMTTEAVGLTLRDEATRAIELHSEEAIEVKARN
jgi:hypothetical protein